MIIARHKTDVPSSFTILHLGFNEGKISFISFMTPLGDEG